MIATCQIGYSDSVGKPKSKVSLYAIVTLCYDFECKKILFWTKKIVKIVIFLIFALIELVSLKPLGPVLLSLNI